MDYLRVDYGLCVVLIKCVAGTEETGTRVEAKKGKYSKPNTVLSNHFPPE